MTFNEYDEITYMETSAPVPYELECFHRQSLNEIRKCIDCEYYNDTSTIAEHILFLEHLADKLQQILSNEQSAGEPAMILRKQIAEIKELHSTLNYMKQKIGVLR